jgi:N-acetylglucosamine kinase-like BadF-type ATPase
LGAYFMGIDGGGTRTTAWLADERGKVVAKAVAGPSNPLKVGFEACERELLQTARCAVAAGLSRHGARQKSGGIKPPLRALVVGLAGVDRPPVHARILAWLRKSIPARHHLLTSDAAIALHAAIGNQPGIMVISGTGSIAYAQDPAHRRVLRCGGWGIPFDDAGSGYEIGREAIAAALRDYDGRGPHTVLGAKICRALKLDDITQVILRRLPPQDIAGLAPLVFAAARRGDFSARLILQVAAHDLDLLVNALIRRLGWRHEKFTIVCAGGIFSGGTAVRSLFSHFAKKAAPRARVTMLTKQPVEGALAMAREIADRAEL